VPSRVSHSVMADGESNPGLPFLSGPTVGHQLHPFGLEPPDLDSCAIHLPDPEGSPDALVDLRAYHAHPLRASGF
jgi:hypothetical protein